MPAEAGVLAGAELQDHDGGSVQLGDLRGSRWAILFLPGAFTPVCTAELPGIQELWARAGAAGVPILAVSCDTAPVLAAWRRAEGLRMPLLSDFWPHGQVADAFGALDAASGRCRRESAIVDAAGRIERRFAAPAAGARDLDGLAAALLPR